jgi:hypothetical protein
MLLKIKKQSNSPIGVYLHRRLKEAGLLAPELIAFNPNAGLGGEAYAIWEWRKGEPVEWGPCEPCPYDEADFGDYSDASIIFDSTGPLVSSVTTHRRYLSPVFRISVYHRG